MKNKKINTYLQFKNKYNELDKLLEKYCAGDLQKIISRYNFSKIDIFPNLHKLGNYIEICLSYQNICCNIIITDEKLEYRIYKIYPNISEIEENIVSIIYTEDFSFDKVIDEIYIKMTIHPEIKDMTKIDKRNKVYKIISYVSLLISTIFIVIMAIICLGLNITINIGPYLTIIFLFIPLLLYTIFSVLAASRK